MKHGHRRNQSPIVRSFKYIERGTNQLVAVNLEKISDNVYDH
jgi:hypothetical protein